MKKDIIDYVHKIQYYETDQMAIVHHSNYIRWFEEARIDFMEQIGVNYATLEETGYVSPVLSVSCEYKTMAKFGESVQITVRLEEFKNVKFKLSYEIKDSESGEIRAIGETTHCFLNKAGHVISLKRENLEIHDLFLEQQE